MPSLSHSARAALQPVRRGIDRSCDWLMFERRFAADTAGRIDLDDLGLDPHERIYYLPTSWLTFRQGLRLVSPQPDDVFADFGSGKGRVVLMAAEFPFRRVIGVELSPALSATAEHNLERNRARVRARSVELVTADAAAWPIPDDLTIAFFFYPFFGSVFETVVGNLLASYDRNPRQLRVVYNCPKDKQTLLQTGRFRETASLRTRYLSTFEVIPG